MINEDVYTPKLYWRVKKPNGKWTWVRARLIYDQIRTGIRSDGTPWTLKGDGVYRVAPYIPQCCEDEKCGGKCA